jgi:CRISPR-associated protein Csm1
VKVNYSNTLTSICQHLGLLEGTPSVELSLLEKAAKWALNALDTEGSLLGRYQPVALRPVLATLKGNQTHQFRKAETLSIDLEMPQPEKPDLTAYFSQLKRELQANLDNHLLLTTLERWGSTLAVNERYNDISLFDFIRTTVGIALCLEKGNGQMRLIGGGISGIQPYLYEIISKNAAKLLKGRSFYVQLLVDSLMNETLEAFDLSDCHVIYASGGGFYVFIPNTSDVEDRFKEFSKSMSEAIYKKHKMTLPLDLALTDVFDASKPVNEIWEGLFQQLEKLKYKRLNNSTVLLDAFFDKVEQGGTREKDPITNEEFDIDDKGKPQKIRLHEGDDANDPNTVWVKPSTKQQIDLGKDLRHANYWLISDKEKIEGLGKATIKDPFDKYHYLEEFDTHLSADATVFALNETSTKFSFAFYGGNKFPINEDGYAKAFDELIDNKDFKRLGILRMDVDGLGSIFSDADKIKSSTYGLNWTRYVAVSRSLDHFFKGYLNKLQQIIEEKLNAKETSVIIYSGGDDLFLVGRWDTVLALAEAIYEKFDKWTNGVLTISGGLELLPAKFPIMQGARLTADAEKKAKKHKYPVYTEGSPLGEKNALTFLETPLSWQHEFDLVNQLQETLYNFIESPKSNTGLSEKGLDKSIIGKINIHAEAQRIYLEKKAQNKPASPQWMWLIAYDLSQVRDRLPKDATNAKAFIDELKNASVSNRYAGEKIKSNYPFLQLLQLAARWAEMRYRSNS